MKYPLKKARNEKYYHESQMWYTLLDCWKNADSLHEFFVKANIVVPHAKKFDMLLFRLYYIKIAHPFLYWMIDAMIDASILLIVNIMITIALAIFDIMPVVAIFSTSLIILACLVIWHMIVLNSSFTDIKNHDIIR